ncbi:MAG: DNA mismatch repair protein MutS [Spirochaetales bacterium]|nr:DNA mismatch repair protein MutS [Spirochaetales bacterium]
MMIQYKKIKEQHKDSILFFRLGDFYEMFDRDAIEASSILDLTLTKRNKVPMCGIPYHASSNYISRLIKAGKKIAICEQVSEPRPGKGIVEREVIEVITPGTVLDEGMLDKKSNNYLVCIAGINDFLSFSYIDLSTSEFFTTAYPFEEREMKLKRELLRLTPREIIIQESLLDEDAVIKKILYEREDIVLNRYPDWFFSLDVNRKKLLDQFNVSNLKGFGLDAEAPEIITAGCILEYIEETSKNIMPHIRSIQAYSDSHFVYIDESTQRNLEIVQNLQDGGKKFTLLDILDHTKTAMGSRKLKKWILNPLLDKEQIERRLDALDFFYRNQILLSNIREHLGKILDLERLSAKIAMDRANAKDLVAVKVSLFSILELYELLSGYPEIIVFFGIRDKVVSEIRQLSALLDKAILEEPAVLITEGGLIREGYLPELDKLRRVKDNAREVLEAYAEKERKDTGITSLKLKYNRIIGYFLEVTKTNLHLVPSHFLRRQSIVSGERYSTNELAEKESEINSAYEKIIDIERELFLEIRNTVKERIPDLQDICHFVSSMDIIQSFAYSTTLHGYTRPQLMDDTCLLIKEGRHPVVEANLPGGSFIPNDITLTGHTGNFILLTGPNMAGKSTFLRQTAHIVLMAQMGCFVPAASAQIGMVDRIFCRVGASDNVARGESTFLVEMNETAHILRSATPKSLLLLDEVGRGTSTNDGLSIAWAVTDYILDKIGAKTIFATHFHELTAINHPSLVNFSMDVLEQDGEIIFLKKIKKGPSSNSYGIHVARLAGLPGEVIHAANRILNEISLKRSQAVSILEERNRDRQPSLFAPQDIIIDEIRNINVNSITPLKAINLLSKWKDELS